MLRCYRRLQFAMCSCLTFHIMMSSQAAVCPVKLTYIPYHGVTIGYSSPRTAASPFILGRHCRLQFAMCNCLSFHIMMHRRLQFALCSCLTFHIMTSPWLQFAMYNLLTFQIMTSPQAMARAEFQPYTATGKLKAVMMPATSKHHRIQSWCNTEKIVDNI
jgi:hypothetical protein